jgi:hypothetical protein
MKTYELEPIYGQMNESIEQLYLVVYTAEDGEKFNIYLS